MPIVTVQADRYVEIFQKWQPNFVGARRPPSVHSFILQFKAKITLQAFAASVEMSLISNNIAY